MIRTFLLKHNQSGKQRSITHYQYLTWPDHGIPKPGPFVELMQLADDSNTTKGPLIVHCSAGLGRTGTFIAVHALLADVKHKRATSKEEPSVRIPYAVMELRKQRPSKIIKFFFSNF